MAQNPFGYGMLAPGQLLPQGSVGAGTVPGAPGSVTIPGSVIPPSVMNQNSLNLGAMTMGALPEDVIRMLRNRAAEFGVAAGLPGSEFQGYQGLTQLGLTSLDQTNKAAQLLNGFYTTPLQKEQLDDNLWAQQQAEAKQSYANAVAAQNRGTGGGPVLVNSGGGGGSPRPGPATAPGGVTNPWLGNALSSYLGGGAGLTVPKYGFSSPMGAGTAPGEDYGPAFAGLNPTPVPYSGGWDVDTASSPGGYAPPGGYGAPAANRNFAVDDSGGGDESWVDSALDALGILG